MLKLRRMLALIAGLTVIVVGGAALAQVGSFAPREETTPVVAADENLAIGIPEDATNDVASGETTETTKSEDPEETDPKSEDPGDDDIKDDEIKDDDGGDDEVVDLGIEILSPAPESHVDVGEIRVKGIVTAAAEVTVNGKPAEVDDEGHWATVVGLEPGKNVLHARAVGADGHVAEDDLVVYWDKEEPPTRLGIEVTSPRSGTETKSESIRIEGFVTAPAKVVVGDWLAEVGDSGKWWVVVPLRPGKNHFVATAHDEHGQKAADEVTIYRITEVRELGIEITNLHNEQKVDDAEIKVWGVVSQPATVTVNGRKATVTDGLEWYVYVPLEPGWNRIVATAVNDHGEAKDVVEIFRVTDKTYEFTANQKFGSCGEAVPYDVFWGTAKPGTVITVVSEYGSADTVTGETGHWELRVEFPEAPFFQEFKVKVKASTGEIAVFTFVRTGEKDV